MAKTNPTAPKSIRADSQEPQEIETKLSTFLERHKDLMGYLGVGIAIIAILFTLINLNSRAKEKQASLLFQKAIGIYDNAMAPDAAAQQDVDPQGTPVEIPTALPDPAGYFQEIIDNYPKTNIGKNAQLLLAASYLNTGKYDQAIQTYDAFITGNSQHPMVPSALLGKATAQFNQGNSSASLETLNYIVKSYPQFELLDAVKLEIGKRYEFEGKWVDAIAAYEEFQQQYPKSPFLYIVQTKISEIEKQHPELKKETEPSLTEKPPA